ncbi:MAG: hypothetical protein CFE26_07355, partial [Verrucomicrobiales bacterium VVV1]
MSNPAANAVAGKIAEAPKKGVSVLNKPAKVKEFKNKELVQMFRGIGSMLRAQINTADALKYYGQGLQDKVMADTLYKIREEIASGVSVHEAFRRTGRFNDMTVGLIQAGADAGQLHQAFKSLASRLASQIRFQKAIKKATVMPSVIIGVLIGAFITSQCKIVPQVEEMLKGVNQKPDGMTAIAFNVSHITQSIWHIVVLSIIGVGITIWRSEKIRTIILGVAMSKWRLLRLLLMRLRQMTFLSTILMLHS